MGYYPQFVTVLLAGADFPAESNVFTRESEITTVGSTPHRLFLPAGLPQYLFGEALRKADVGLGREGRKPRFVVVGKL